MLKLVINYDMMDKITIANGEHKLKMIYKCYAKQPMVMIPGLNNVVIGVSNVCQGIDVASNVSVITLTLGLFFVGIPVAHPRLEKVFKEKFGVKTLQESAIDSIRDLSYQFNNQNINTTPELLLNSYVYHKKYKLAMNGKAGVIRERYINVPTYGFNNEISESSILEEHKIGSREYVLTLGSPKKQMAFKPVYNN